METLVPYAVYLVLAIVALGMVAIVLFGIRNLTHGKVAPSSVILSAIPVVLLVILGLVLGDWSVAAIYTVLIALVLTAGAMVISGTRGLFS